MNNWIWLPQAAYPRLQSTRPSAHEGEGAYAVAEFRRDYSFPEKTIKEVRLTLSGDTAFLLFDGAGQIVRGPAWVGGDFLYNGEPRPEYYAQRVTFMPQNAHALSFRAIVRMGPVRICEYSRGVGGFMLSGEVRFDDGSAMEIASDESWQARLLPGCTAPYAYDGAIAPPDYLPAASQLSPVAVTLAPTRPCAEAALPLPDCGELHFTGAGSVSRSATLDRIYGCYITLRYTGAPARVTLRGCELPGDGGFEYSLCFAGDDVYYGMELHAVGHIDVSMESDAAGEHRLLVELRASHYPIGELARTATSDSALNKLMDVCAHALKYCRQSIHLDSPKHCEPLACTGDYYIETLMTAMTYGDMSLASFDVTRTGNLLRHHDGEMFHTSYSLIWPLMMWDVYMFTGDIQLLRRNQDALDRLLHRFAGYVGDNGLLEYAPNYMFIDWLNPDGINLHHPPKALGQTCLCLFYWGALGAASRIYTALNRLADAENALACQAALGTAIRDNLWDDEKGLFFEGLNTPTPENLIGFWMPANVSKRYYRRHANILAAYFGFFDREGCQALLRRVAADDTLGEVQPYFQHFLLEAVYRNGLRQEMTLPLLDQWKPFIAECDKGLPEGFYKPDPGYRFDHSHAWAGSPAWSLPLALSGLAIIRPGYEEIALSPSLMGLDFADVEIPTPHGMIRIHMARGKATRVTIPQGIRATLSADCITC